MDSKPDDQPHPILKLVLEIGPLAVFFLTFRYGEDLLAAPTVHDALARITGPEVLAGHTGPIFVATAFFMVAIALSLGVSWWMTRTLPKMAVVTAIVVTVFGGLTLWLQDETFIKMKPTIVHGPVRGNSPRLRPGLQGAPLSKVR